MLIKNQLATLLIIITFVSCAFPGYKQPQTNTLPNWNSAESHFNIESGSLAATAWWKKFGDNALDNLVESALSNNNDIQIAIGNIMVAQGQLQQVQSSWIPLVNATAGYQQRALYAEGYNIGLIPSYNINILQLFKQLDYAKANYAMQKAVKNAVRITVIGQVTGAYITLSSQMYLLELQQQLVQQLYDILALSQIQYSNGMISLYTLQQYIQQYHQATTKVPTLKSNIVASQNAISVLLNRNPSIIKTVGKLNDLKITGVLPINTPSSVLRHRPDILQAEQQLIAANANIGSASAQFFPNINLTGNAGSSSDSLSGLFDPANEFWVRSATISMPILNFSIYGQVNQAKGAYYAAYYNYIKTVRTAFASVDSDLAANSQSTISLHSQEHDFASTVLAYNLAATSYRAGLFSKPTLLSNAITMTNAAIVLAQAKQAELNSIVQLYQDLAAGYDYHNTESSIKFMDSHDPSWW